ncbi:MAG: hypothetical protein JWP75_2359 [Frondihabitans sp.]|nr:hypothetical protein [Frondihabitans sp.]
MTDVVVGMDIGGTKSAIRVETLSGEFLLDTTVPSEDWDAEPIASGAAWVDAALRGVLPAEWTIAQLALGAQGLDTEEIARKFSDRLGALGYRARAVNDAALLVPAAGLDRGVGVISGTGAIAVGESDSGAFLAAGGWGWVIGDEGGAAGLVREAVRDALSAHDDGVADDGLLSTLLRGFDAPDAERLARRVNDEPTMDNWAPRAEAVFSAAEAGSALATARIRAAADHLSHLVTQLVRRGAAGSDIVAAGGMIVNQPVLWQAFRESCRAAHPGLAVHLLTEPPVVGAVALARALTPVGP